LELKKSHQEEDFSDTESNDQPCECNKCDGTYQPENHGKDPHFQIQKGSKSKISKYLGFEKMILDRSDNFSLTWTQITQKLPCLLELDDGGKSLKFWYNNQKKVHVKKFPPMDPLIGRMMNSNLEGKHKA